MATPMKKLAESLESKVTYHSDQCMNHSYEIGGQTIIKPVQMIIYQGKPVCPRCVVEQNNKVLEEQANAHYKRLAVYRNLTCWKRLVLLQIRKFLFRDYLITGPGVMKRLVTRKLWKKLWRT